MNSLRFAKQRVLVDCKNSFIQSFWGWGWVGDGTPNILGRGFSSLTSLIGVQFKDLVPLKPGAHERKQLNKKSHEAISSVVSSRVRVRETNICRS